MALEVTSISASLYNDIEITDLTRKICDTIAPLIEEGHPHLTPLVEDSRAHCDALQTAVGRNRGSDLTEQIHEKNAERQELSLALVKGVEYYLNHPNEEMKKAASLIDELIDRQGRGYFRESNRSHSVKLQQLLDDLSEEQPQQALTSLILKEHYDGLVVKNKEFSDLISQRNSEEANDNTPLLRPTRKILRDNLYTFEQFFIFHGRVDESNWGETIRSVNEYVTEVNAVAKSRKTRNEDEEHDEGETVEEGVFSLN